MVAGTVRATGRASKLLPRRPRDASAALALVAAVGCCAGCGGGSRQDAHEPEATLPHAGDPGQLPPPAGGVPAGDARNRVAQRRHPDGAQRGGHRGLADLRLQLCRAGRPDTRPIWADRTGPRGDRDPAGGNPGAQPPRGAPRPRPRKPGRWAASRPVTAPASCGSWSRSSPVPTRCTSATRAGLAGKSKVRLAAGSRRGSLVVHIAGRPPATHVNPETGKVVPGPYIPSSEAETS